MASPEPTVVAGGNAFLSYSHADKDVAIAVQAAMEERGWTTFRDETDIEPGEDLPPVIAEAIDSAELFVALVSTSYVDSSPCRWELSQAVARRFGDDQLRIVALRADETPVPNEIRAALYVKIDAGREVEAVEAALRRRRNADASMQSGRSEPAASDKTETDVAAGTDSAGDNAGVREAVRYARELDALAAIDHRLVDAQAALQSVTRNYDAQGYQDAYESWQEAWIKLTLPVRDTELLSRIQAVGSLLSEVVLSDRTPRQIKPWMLLRAIASARAAIGYVMRGQLLPEPSFPSMPELRQLLGQGDSLDDPAAPLRQRLSERDPPVFHG